MGTTGERLNRRCDALHFPPELGAILRCSKEQGHQGHHAAKATVMFEWDVAWAAPSPEQRPTPPAS